MLKLHLLLLLLLRLFPSSGVTGIVGYKYNSSTLSCPIRPPPITKHFPYLFFMRLSAWFSVSRSVSFLVLLHLTFFLLSMYPSSLHLTCPYHLTLFSVIFVVTGSTFTELLSHVRFLLFSLWLHYILSQLNMLVLFCQGLFYKHGLLWNHDRSCCWKHQKSLPKLKMEINCKSPCSQRMYSENENQLTVTNKCNILSIFHYYTLKSLNPW